MACKMCGDCCRKFAIRMQVGKRMLQTKKDGQEYAVRQFSPQEKFKEFLNAMGFNTGNMFVKIPLASVTEDARTVYMTFYHTCPHLLETNLCGIHETKPAFCRDWMCTVARLDATEMLEPDLITCNFTEGAGDESSIPG